jgi:hypothetical protein
LSSSPSLPLGGFPSSLLVDKDRRLSIRAIEDGGDASREHGVTDAEDAKAA